VITARDEVHLAYIAESIELIEHYTAGGKRVFEEETIVQDGVLRRLETLADAASKLPQQVKDRHPEIPWRDVQDFRNVAAHGYTEIDFEVVWRIVVDDLPPLLRAVQDELRAVGRTPEVPG
jgi:uncharacterized protein with HEPN domain